MPRCLNRMHHLTCFLSASVTRKHLHFGTWTDPLSNNTTNSVLQHREVGWAKDLSASPHKCKVRYSYLSTAKDTMHWIRSRGHTASKTLYSTAAQNYKFCTSQNCTYLYNFHFQWSSIPNQLQRNYAMTHQRHTKIHTLNKRHSQLGRHTALCLLNHKRRVLSLVD